MRTVAFAVLSVIVVAVVPALGYPLPPGSEERAERYALWRVEVEKGEQALAEGRWPEAESAFLKVIEGSRAIDDTSMLFARALDGLGDLRRGEERWGNAERLYLEAAGLWEKYLGPEQPRLAITLHNLGVVQIGQRHYEEACATLGRALAVLERTLGPDAAQAVETRTALEAAVRLQEGSSGSTTGRR
jgi:tetratricopeptide (TPR) repeat protein